MDYSKAEAKLAARERFTGLWAAITVPFGTDGGIGEAALRADLDRLTGELGIDGIFSGGVMSEFWALSGAERRRPPRWWPSGRGGGARCSRTPGSTARRRRSS